MMLEWHRWTAGSSPPPENETLLFAERGRSISSEQYWITGTGYYLQDLGLSGDIRLSRSPRDAWPREMYWARFNRPDDAQQLERGE